MGIQSQLDGSRKERLRKMFLTKRAEVGDHIREELRKKITENLNSVLGPVLDLADLSTLNLERDVDYELLNMHTETLRKIDGALERLDQGTYGICEECDGEIGERRLQAVPFALYCLECQRRKEQLKLTDSVSF